MNNNLINFNNDLVNDGNDNNLITVKRTYKHHGLSTTRLYQIWRDMNRRCYDEFHKDYDNYGGRGIKICKEWRDDVQVFVDWAYENGYEDDLTIDRINNSSGNYEPNNCRWADSYTQHNNCRNNRYYTSLDGETHNITTWSEITGLSPSLIIYRLKKGWENPLSPKRQYNQIVQ